MSEKRYAAQADNDGNQSESSGPVLSTSLQNG